MDWFEHWWSHVDKGPYQHLAETPWTDKGVDNKILRMFCHYLVEFEVSGPPTNALMRIEDALH